MENFDSEKTEGSGKKLIFVVIAIVVLGALAIGGYYLTQKNGNDISVAVISPAPMPTIESTLDSDSDTIPDVVEIAIGTNPNKMDTDGDGFDDLAEIKSGYSPLIAGVNGKYTTEEWDNVKGKIKIKGREFYEREFGVVAVNSNFTCGTDTVSDVDGNAYNTVQIGDQCWLKENLKVTKNPAGKTIDRDCYNNDPGICNTDGGLYTWLAAMNIIISNIQTFESSIQAKEPAQGICPNGWHIPRDSEWSTLENYLEENKAKTASGSFMLCSGADGYWIGCGSAGVKLRQGGSSGFEAVYAGSVENTHSPIALPNEFWYKEYLYKSNWEDTDRASKFSSRGESVYFWSSTSLHPRIPQDYPNTRLYEAWFRKLSSVHGGTLKDNAIKNRGGMSVRCLKD